MRHLVKLTTHGDKKKKKAEEERIEDHGESPEQKVPDSHANSTWTSQHPLNAKVGPVICDIHIS